MLSPSPTQSPPSQPAAGRIRWDREKWQRSLVESASKTGGAYFSCLEPFFQWLDEWIFKIGLLCGLIEAPPPARVDFSLLSQLVRGSPEPAVCSPSMLLRYVREQIGEQNPPLRERLEKAAEWSLQIEQFQRDDRFRPDSKKFTDFIAGLKGEMAGLGIGEKRIIPGGWQRKEKPFASALYEVERSGEEAFCVRLLSLEEEYRQHWKGEENLESGRVLHQPLLEFKEVKLGQLQESLAPLVELQLPQMFREKSRRGGGFLEKYIGAFERFLAGDRGSAAAQGELSPLVVMSACYKKSPEPSDQSPLVKVPKSPPFAKTLFAYLKAVNPQQYKSTKLRVELSAFFECINQEDRALLQNRELRALVQDSARKLLHELGKNREASGLEPGAYEAVVKDLRDILILMQTLDQKERRLFTPPLTPAPLERTFNWHGVTDPGAFHALPPAAPKPLEAVPFITLLPTTQTVEPNQVLEALQKQIEALEGLYAREDYAALEAHLLDLIRRLPSAGGRQNDFWKNAFRGLTFQECSTAIEQWHQAIFRLSELSFECHQAQGGRLPPEQVAAQAHLLALADPLMVRKCARESQCRGCMIYFDPKELKEVLRRDPYFRLASAPEHQMAEGALSYWDHVGRNQEHDPRHTLCLDHYPHFNTYAGLRNQYENGIPKQSDPELQAYIDEHAANDYDYVVEVLTNKFGEEEASKHVRQLFGEVEGDVSEHAILPREVRQQRKMHLMMKGLLAHQHAFVISDPKEFLAVGSRMVEEAGGRVDSLSHYEMHQRLWKIQDERVAAKFRENSPKVDPATQKRGPIRWILEKNGHFSLHPTGVRFDLTAFTGNWKKYHSDREFYREAGRPLDPHTDGAIVQFQLGVKNEGERVLTQQSLLNHAASEEEVLLRSMQAGDSRLEQTFATFAQHPELLNSPSRYRLFELNLFQQGALFKKIAEQPAFARELLSFALDNWKVASGAGEIERALFFLELRHRVADYVHRSTLTEEQKSEILHSLPSGEEYELLLNKCHGDQERRAVHGARLAHYLEQMEARSLDLDHLETKKREEVLQNIFTGYFLYRSLNPGPEGRNPRVDQQLQHLMTRVRPHFKKLLEDPQRAPGLLAQVCQAVFGPSVTDQKVRSTFPRLSLGPYTIDVDRGLVFENGKAKGLLPNEVLEHEWVQRLFGNKKGGLSLGREAQITYRIDPKTGSEVLIYTFEEREDLRLIQRAGGGLVVQMKMHGQRDPGWFSSKSWYELTSFEDPNQTDEPDPEHQLPGELSDLIQGRAVWREVDRPSHVLVREAHENGGYLYDAKLERAGEGWQWKEVRRVRDGLFLMRPSEGERELGDLAAVEDPSHISIWANSDQEIREFEFPRIKMGDGRSLAYRVKTVLHRGQPTEAQVLERDGFMLHFQAGPLRAGAPKGNLGTELLPPLFHNFQLLIHHRTGAQKVLIPLQPATRGNLSNKEARQEERYAHWSDQVRLDHHTHSLENQTLLEFEVDSIHKRLKSEDKEANLFLAYLFFTSKHYEQGLEFLKASETSLGLSDSHRALYDWIDGWPDTTPEGAAFKLKTALQLKAHRSSTGLDLAAPEEQLSAAAHLEELHQIYTGGIGRLSTGLKLSEREAELYESAIHSTYLPALPWKPLETATVPLPAAPWVSPKDRASDRVEPEQLARQLFLSMENLSLSELEWSFASDHPFIEGFRAVYETLYNAEVDSEEFRKIAQLVEFARPPSQAARTVQSLLKELIFRRKQLANIPHEFRGDTFHSWAFPKEFKRPYFRLSRIAAELDNPSLNALNKMLAALDKAASETEKAQDVRTENGEKSAEASTPSKRERGYDLDQLDIGLSLTEKELLKDTKELMEKEGDQKGASAETFIRTVQREGKLHELAKQRRITALEGRLEKAWEFLSALDAPQAPSRGPAPAPASSPVFSESLSNFFEEAPDSTYAGDGGKRKSAITTLFAPYTGGGNVSPAVRRLAEQYETDTAYFVEQGSANKRKLKADTDAQQLNQTMQDELGAASKARQRAESAILSLITPHRGSGAKRSLAAPLKTVPQRLIGLYTDGPLEKARVNALWGVDLDDAQIRTLDDEVKSWMTSAIQERMAEKGLAELRGISNLSEAPQEVIEELGEKLSPNRSFQLEGEAPDPYFRELLAIEFSTGFILRANQVETLHAMLQDPNQVKQLGMGQGKSSVILPMLLRRLADGEHLALGIVPEALYPIVVSDLDKSSRNLFGQELFKFEFDRNTPMDREWILSQSVMLGEAIRNRHAVVTTKTALLSFRNKFLEMQRELAGASEEERAVLNPIAEQMAFILHLFKTRGAALADEIDTILDVRQELNYALGLPQSMDAKKWQMGMRLYRKLLQACPEHAERLRRNEQGLFTLQEIQEIQTKTSQAFFEEWETQLPHGMTSELFCKYVSGETSLELEEGLPPFMKGLKTSNPDLYQEIGLLRQYLSKTLPTTLSHSGNVHYGRAADGENTIPYKANNTPSEAEFGEEFERIGHFIQDYLQNGLSEHQVRSWITGLTTRISAEMHEQLKTEGSMGAFEEMPSYQQFHEAFPGVHLNRLSQDPAQFAAFFSRLNANEETRLTFLENWVFPRLEMAPLQVSSNAHDLVNMLGSFSGFTGTPWNVDTFPRNIRSDHAQARGTDGKTVDLLMQLSDSGKLEIREVEMDSETPLTSLLKSNPDFMKRYSSLIDGGYYLKGVEPSEVAEALGKKKGTKQALVYVTADNQKVVQTLGRADAQPLANRPHLAMEQRMTYYDHSHIVGTDIPHAQTARAALTIGEKMYVKDLFQALWRMRKIDKGQRVDLIVSKKVAALIRANRTPSEEASDSLTLRDILLFCIKNQAEREAEDNLRAERQKLTGLVPDALFWQLVEAVLNAPDPGLFEACQSFLLKNIGGDTDALCRVAAPEETLTVLETLRDSLVKTFSSLKKTIPESFQEGLGTAIDQLQDHKFLEREKLPEKSEQLSSDAKESQVQTQRQQQQQISIETHASTAPPNPKEEWNAWEARSLQELWACASEMERANPAAHEGQEEGIYFFDEGVRFTPNFAPKPSDAPSSLSDRLLAPKRIPVSQVVVLEKENANGTRERRTLLVDIKDYENVVSKLMRPTTNQGFRAAVFDVRPKRGALLLKSTENGNSSPWEGEEWKQVNAQLVKVKVFNRQFEFYNKEEIEALEEWVRKDRRLKDYVEKRLLTPKEAESYPRSTLAKCFESPAK